jgi:lactose/L-arabinose transport system ATP-binding protein
MSRIELRNIVKSFGAVEVIHDVSLDIEQGKFVVFVGPSGCGKSTLLRMIAGLEEVTSGSVMIGERDVTDEEPSERGVAMVFQSYALYPHMTVYENMSFSLRLAGRPKAEIDDKVGRAAAILRLDELLDRKPGQLSGGQRQRVAIGRAIVRDPEVFLFDEPLSNLDAELRVQMRVEIAKLHKMLGNTMVYVTHDQTEAMTLADVMVVLRAGRIEQVGSPLDLYQNPGNAFVAGFIGSPRMNFLKARSLGGGAFAAGGTEVAVPSLTAVPAGTEVELGIRPEHLEAPGGVELEVVVDVIEELGGTSYLHGSLPTGEIVVAERRLGRDRIGDKARLSFMPDSVRLFATSGERIA